MFLTRYERPTYLKKLTDPLLDDIDLFSDKFFNFKNVFDEETDIITKTDDGWQATINVPGFNKDDISVFVEEDILKIEAKNDKKRAKKQFKYSLKIPNYVNKETITACCMDGVLTIDMKNDLSKKRFDVRVT